MQILTISVFATAWILAALIMAVPIAQMYWPYNPSLRFPAMAVASQVFSWILGWLAVQLLNRLVYSVQIPRLMLHDSI